MEYKSKKEVETAAPQGTTYIYHQFPYIGAFQIEVCYNIDCTIIDIEDLLLFYFGVRQCCDIPIHLLYCAALKVLSVPIFIGKFLISTQK
jgi:hypothetical protein